MRENPSKESVHYVYVCAKQEGADEQSAQYWAAVEAQIRKEEVDDENIMDDSYDEEEEEQAEGTESAQKEGQ
ncbi:hypothetical protein FGO68_gene2225 [Halteria grandinella]|uniref:Uncharacterized protein n=1 Tax=Halteria grandinella TaxID=5974 RepID=A0A8J8T8L2_HALGN|nr:hypothetical protein FGO68_gene2225 [Halteria grandinella]